MAGVPGNDPGLTVLETVVLPLHHTPKLALVEGIEPPTKELTAPRSTSELH